MPTYAYSARNASGQLSSGSLIAATMTEALQMIRAEGKYPVSVKPAERGQPAAETANTGIGRAGIKISRNDLIQFSTQLAVMVETGVTLSEAVECIAKQAEKPNMKDLLADLSDQLQGGASFSEALARHPRSFPTLYIALIRASEKSGMLSRLLVRATDYLRDERETLRRVKGALTYPLIMFSFAVLTTIFLLTFVLPRFTVIYAQKKAALPMPTLVLMTASDFLVGHWLALLIGSIISAIAAFVYLRTEQGQRVWHFLQLNLPLFGALYRKVHLSRGLRMVGTMAGAGVALFDCVTTAYQLCPNTYFRELWKRIGDQLQAGRQLSDPLFESNLVPRPVAQMIFSGEKSGKLSSVMEQVAGFSEQELKEQIAALTRYIEPVMICTMGLIIGGVSLALLLPIFTISKVMAGH